MIGRNVRWENTGERGDKRKMNEEKIELSV